MRGKITKPVFFFSLVLGGGGGGGGTTLSKNDNLSFNPKYYFACWLYLIPDVNLYKILTIFQWIAPWFRKIFYKNRIGDLANKNSIFISLMSHRKCRISDKNRVINVQVWKIFNRDGNYWTGFRFLQESVQKMADSWRFRILPIF